MPPQTAVALYIYRVGRSCPARNPFTARNSQGLLNWTRIRGPPVRPTGQTGVAVARAAIRRPIGQTVEGHRSDRWRQPDRPRANFGCEQLDRPIVTSALEQVGIGCSVRSRQDLDRVG
jgi:hypothetical protein